MTVERIQEPGRPHVEGARPRAAAGDPREET